MFQKGYIRMLHIKVVVVGSINMDLVTRATQFARARLCWEAHSIATWEAKVPTKQLPPHA